MFKVFYICINFDILWLRIRTRKLKSSSNYSDQFDFDLICIEFYFGNNKKTFKNKLEMWYGGFFILPLIMRSGV